MSSAPFTRYLNPWKFKREQKQLRFAALRERDGDNCSRCRRPMRFDLPQGHDLAPTLEHLQPQSNGAASALDDLCLCHVRCHGAMIDHTSEVVERMRRKNEAELFARSPRKK